MRIRALLPGFLLLAACASPSTPGARNADLALELFQISGMDTSLAGFLPGLLESLDTELEALPPEVSSRMVEVVRSAFAPEAMQAAAIDSLRSQIDPGKAETAIAYLRTPFGRRVTQLENEANDPNSMERILAYAESLEASPPDPARVAQVQRLDRAVRGTDMFTEIMTAFLLIPARAILAVAPEAGSIEELEAAFQAERPAFREASEGLYLITALHTYRELSVDELGTYLDFLESPPGQWFQRAGNNAFMAAIEDCDDRFVAGLADVFREMAAP